MPDDQKIDANEIMMQLRYLQNVYSQHYEALENDVATYTIANTSLQRNIDLLENAVTLENSNIIISGEGGAYIPAKISKVDSVMTYVGAGYLVEKSVAESSEFLRKNQKKSEEFLNRLMSDKQRIERELMDISFKLNALQAQEGQQ
jgi:prefoldin alpha subunit